ncbi:MAG: penicillin acylase family protein [Bacteroidota bacterium]
MRLLLLVLSLGLVLAALVAGTVSALAYGADATRAGEIEIAGVRQPVTLSWDAIGTPTLEASTLPDLALGLGYIHAADDAWTLALWRQAGRGGLGAWFGPEVRPLDRHARTLGFEALAQQTYRSLDEETRDILDAYAAGVNAALTQPGVAKGDAFVLADVSPEAWRPWDALLVERLLAYLATPAPAADAFWKDAARQDSALVPFVRTDSTFRATLGIGGTDGARAFVAGASEGSAFVAHQPAGASTLDLFAPVTLRLNGETLSATSIPGTLSLPIGWTSRGGWAVFLTSSHRLEVYSGPSPPPVHSRIVERDGNEVLLSIPRDTTGLVLAPPMRPVASPMPQPNGTSTEAGDTGSTGWRLAWSGFRPGTDVPAFLALMTGAPTPTFSLLRGDGLQHRAGESRVLGSPPATSNAPNGVFAGATSSAQRAGDVLAWMDNTLQSRLSASALASSDASLWAAQTLPPLLLALGNRDSLDRTLDAPYAFLKGWNYRYTPEAIAPSLFETWLASHEAYTGHAPDPSDSLDVLLLPHTLRIARAALRDAYGPEATAWQWGHVQGGFVHPVLEAQDTNGITSRSATPTTGAGGHPTTLVPGPSRPAGAPYAVPGQGPATWSAWALLGQQGLSVRTPVARIASPDTDRLGPAIFSLGEQIPSDRPRLILLPPS